MLKLLNIVTDDPQPRSEIEAWGTRLEKLSGIQKITDANKQMFIDLLAKENDADSYLTSPVYYNFTGRKGLWIYREENSYVPLCWHPNVPGQILVFPVRGDGDLGVMKSLLGKIPEPPAGVRLARVKTDSSFSSHANQITGSYSRDVILVPVGEAVLDWKYPVRILSTGRLADMNDPTLKRVRNRIRKAESHNIQVEKLSRDNRLDAENFLHQWALNRSRHEGETEELLSPYKAMLDCIDGPKSTADGAVFRINGKVVAYSLWDISNPQTPTANRHANVCESSHIGLSDYVMKTTAKTLYSQGVRHMNIGGSETKSLDDYKNKFLPESSIALCSVQVIIDDAPTRDQIGNQTPIRESHKIAV